MHLRRLFFLTLLALAVPSAPGRGADAPSPRVLTWAVGADVRRALVIPPSRSAGSGRAPLVLSFHGHGDDMENFQHTAIHRAWPEAVVVYFDGLPSRRDGLSGWQTERGQDDDRDLALVDVALAGLRQQFAIDDARVYATGFSNGANFTYLLWAERPGVFAAYAPVAARLRPSVLPKVPKPLFHVAGVRDRQIPFDDQEVAMDTARRVDRVRGEGASCGDGCTIYGAGTSAPVMTWIHPGGHVYPAGTSEKIAAFFKDHRLTAGAPAVAGRSR